MWKRIRWRIVLAWNERCSKETNEAACVHADNANEGLSTPEDHETDLSSEWIRNLETFSGRVGAGEQRSMSSDADAVAAMSSHGKQRSSLGGVGTSCTQYEAQNLDTLRDTIKAATLAHNPQDSEWCRYVRLSERDEAAEV